MTIDLVRLSRTISHALRHDPSSYGLALDEHGWVPVEELLDALRRKRRAWRELTAEDVERMMASADKQRFEMADGRIRALYGHSLERKMQKTVARPPEVLYHGTPPGAAERILVEGLRPMRRQYVHLSTDEATARQIGSRRTQEPVILRIRASEAYDAGVRFYIGNDRGMVGR